MGTLYTALQRMMTCWNWKERLRLVQTERCRSFSVKWTFSEVSPAFNLLMACLVGVMCMRNNLVICQDTPMNKTCKPHKHTILITFMLWFFFFFSAPLISRRSTYCRSEICHWMAHKYLYWTQKNVRWSLKLVTYTVHACWMCHATARLSAAAPFISDQSGRDTRISQHINDKTLRASDLCPPEGPLSSQHWTN